MKNIKQKFFIRAILFLAVVLSALFLAPSYPSVSITVYLYDPCGGCFTAGVPCKPCTVENRMLQEVDAVLRNLSLKDKIQVRIHNTLREASRAEYDAFRLRRGLTGADNYPVIEAGRQVLTGMEQFETQFAGALKQEYYGILAPLFSGEANPQNIVSIEEDGSARIIYFKTEGCAQCVQFEILLKELQNAYDFTADIYDLSQLETLAVQESYCETYALDPDAMVTPTILIGETVLSGYDEIETFLEARIKDGSAFRTPGLSND